MGNTLFTFTSKADWQAGTVPPQIDLDSEPGKVKLYRPALTFSRATAANLPDGTLVPSGSPRYVAGKFGQAVMIEEGTTNWAFDSGIESGTVSSWSGGAGWVGVPVANSTRPGTYALKADFSTTGNRFFTNNSQVTRGSGDSVTISAWIWTAAGTAQIGAHTHDNTWTINKATSVVVVETTPRRYSFTFSATDMSTVTSTLLFGFINDADGGAGNKTVYFDDVQIEVKPYATSFVAGTRNAETLVIPGINWANVSFTVEAWVNISADKGTGDHGILTSNEVGAFYKSLHLVIRDGKPYLGFYGDDLASPTVVTDGNWHFVAFGYDSLTKRQVIWVDGQPPIFHTVASQYLGKISDTFIGGGTSPALDGYMANLRISTVLRTDAEIAADYNATAPLAADAETLALCSFDGTLISEYPASGTLITKAFDLGRLHEMPLRLDMPTSGGNVVIQYQSSPDGVNGWQPWLDMQGDKTGPYVGPWIRFKMVLYAAP